MNNNNNLSSQLKRHRLTRNPEPIKGIIFGLLAYYIIVPLVAIPLGAAGSIIYYYFTGVTTAEFEALLDSNDFLISLSVDILGAVTAIFSGYICSKYAKKKVYLFSLIMWLPIFLLTIWSFDVVWEQYFVPITTFLGVILGVYLQQRKSIKT